MPHKTNYGQESYTSIMLCNKKIFSFVVDETIPLYLSQWCGDSIAKSKQAQSPFYN